MSIFGAVQLALWAMRQFGPSRTSPSHVRRIQASRLRRLLTHAVERSPFYRAKLRGVDPSRAPLSDLPTTTKAELMAEFDRVVTDSTVTRADLERFVDDPGNVGRFFRGRYPVCHTSGSQGQPLLLVQNDRSLELLFAFQMTRGNADYTGSPVEAARRLFSPGRVAVLISRAGFFPSAWAWRHLPPALRPFVRVEFLQPGDAELIGKLNRYSPTVLTGTPTALDMLAVRAGELRLPHLRQAVTWSETLTVAARERIATTFRVPVLDTYGCGECLFLTTGCPHGGAHVNADWVILEVVDERNRPVPAGQTGAKVLLTNLANTVQPLIRYELGDRLTMATAPCGCGNRLPRIERVQGRAADLFWVRSGAGYRPLTTYPFQHAFDHLRGVREWQATQYRRNAVLVRFELLPDGTVDLGEARRRLAERVGLAGFGGEVDVTFEVVPVLAADPGTGKFRRMVSLVGVPDDFRQPLPAVRETA